MNGSDKIKKMLEVIRDEILPLTEGEIANGNGTTGGAVLRADTLTSVMIGSSGTRMNPIMHGEMDALIRFFKLPVHPDPSELIFLTTHEPCAMCATAIGLAGFREIWTLRDSKICNDTCSDIFGTKMRDENPMFVKRSLRAAAAEDPEAEALIAEIDGRYDALADAIKEAKSAAVQESEKTKTNEN